MAARTLLTPGTAPGFGPCGADRGSPGGKNPPGLPVYRNPRPGRTKAKNSGRNIRKDFPDRPGKFDSAMKRKVSARENESGKLPENSVTKTTATIKSNPARPKPGSWAAPPAGGCRWATGASCTSPTTRRSSSAGPHGPELSGPHELSSFGAQPGGPGSAPARCGMHVVTSAHRSLASTDARPASLTLPAVRNRPISHTDTLPSGRTAAFSPPHRPHSEAVDGNAVPAALPTARTLLTCTSWTPRACISARARSARSRSPPPRTAAFSRMPCLTASTMLARVVRAFSAGDRVMLGRDGAVVRRRQPHVGVPEQTPVLVADPKQIVVAPHAQAGADRAPKNPGERRVQGSP